MRIIREAFAAFVYLVAPIVGVDHYHKRGKVEDVHRYDLEQVQPLPKKAIVFLFMRFVELGDDVLTEDTSSTYVVKTYRGNHQCRETEIITLRISQQSAGHKLDGMKRT